MFAAYPLYLWQAEGDPWAFLHAQRIWNRHLSPAGPFGGIWDGVRAGWAGGPADISLAYNRTDLLQLTTQGNYTVMGIGGTLTFGAFKPMFQYIRHKVDINNAVAPDPERADWLLGIVASFGALDVRASYNRYDLKNTSNDAQQLAGGIVYNLSRRPAFYGPVAQMVNKGAGTAFQHGNSRRTPFPRVTD